jgi:hypothetical protein
MQLRCDTKDRDAANLSDGQPVINFVNTQTYHNHNINSKKSWQIYWLLYDFHLFHDNVNACINIED